MGLALNSKLDTVDVLVIGGGLAGLMAAIAARGEGSEVLVWDKAHPRRSGAATSGLDHLSTLMYPESDLNKYTAKDVRNCEGILDPSLSDLWRQSWDVVSFLEQIGVQVRNSRTGEYIWVATAHNLGEKMSLSIEGHDLKLRLYGEAIRRGVRFWPRVMGSRLLLDQQGQVAGVVGLNTRSGEVVAAKAGAVVLATGATVRLYRSIAGIRFNTHHSPYCTGDGLAMAYQVGAQLTNLEFTSTQPSPKNLSMSGISGVISMGAHFINRLGERFMGRYHPKLEHAPKHVVAAAFLAETAAGNAPMYVDFRHLSPEQLDLLFRGFREEDPKFLQYLDARGIDLTMDPVEYELHELYLGSRPSGGIRLVNTSCATTMPYLYAAGDCTGGNSLNGGMGSMLGGKIAGKAAARAAAGREQEPSPLQDPLLEDQQRFSQWQQAATGYTWQDVEDKIKGIMTDYVGYSRNQQGLELALLRLDQLDPVLAAMQAPSPHQAMRCQEVVNLALVARLVARAALTRQESRLTPYHFRSDFPASDDARWLQLVVIQKQGDFQAPIPDIDQWWPVQERHAGT